MWNDQPSGRPALTKILKQIHDSFPEPAVAFSDALLPPPAGVVCMGAPRLHFVLEGLKGLTCSCRGRRTELELAPGTWLYTPPSSWLVPDWTYRQKTFGVVFHHGFTRVLYFEHAGDGSQSRRHGPDRAFHTDRPLPVDGVHLLGALNELVGEERPAVIARHLMIALSHLVLDELDREALPAPDPSRELWSRVVSYLGENCQQPIDRNSVATAFHLHPNSLSRLFKVHGTLSFKDHLARFRIDRSCRLLRDSERTLEAVAQDCGFANANYFIKVFRKATGRTPGQYRESLETGS